MTQGIRGSADIPSDGECYFCTVPVTDVDYCEGCDEFVCSACVDGADGSYRHSVEEHGDGLYD